MTHQILVFIALFILFITVGHVIRRVEQLSDFDRPFCTTLPPAPGVQQPPAPGVQAPSTANSQAKTIKLTWAVTSMCNTDALTHDGILLTLEEARQLVCTTNRISKLSKKPTFVEYANRLFYGLISLESSLYGVIDVPASSCAYNGEVCTDTFRTKIFDTVNAWLKKQPSYTYNGSINVLLPSSMRCEGWDGKAIMGVAGHGSSSVAHFNYRTMMHELMHSNALRDHSLAQVVTSTGQVNQVDYGDATCIMGRGMFLNVAQARNARLAVIRSENVTLVEPIEEINPSIIKSLHREYYLPDLTVERRNYLFIGPVFKAGSLKPESFETKHYFQHEYYISYYPPNTGDPIRDVQKDWADCVYVHMMKDSRIICPTFVVARIDTKTVNQPKMIAFYKNPPIGTQDCCIYTEGSTKYALSCEGIKHDPAIGQLAKQNVVKTACPTDWGNWHEMFTVTVLRKEKRNGIEGVHIRIDYDDFAKLSTGFKPEYTTSFQ
jgi:hypothetical protein